MSLLETQGRIFNIQRYSIHDGPGIRTNVFFKGCPLRCKWCCNPESQSIKIETMTSLEGTQTVGRDVTVGEIMQEVEQDAPYYRRSGGGVTLTGGECTLQPDFAVAILTACKQRGISTAIETSAFTTHEILDRFIPVVDYWMMDIKHMDSEKHKLYTGQPNERILDNAKYIAERHPHVTIRVPVIPGVNDNEEDIKAIASFASKLGGGVVALHLLPYHRLGEDKYQRLGRNYFLRGLNTIPNEKMQELLKAAGTFGLKTQIGG